ncbi:uncharacterized protein [Diabrotica undecimpunctata]|uniref:uncharacterized protein n=1 Tax=Diabrotica undecimpunctata TaxID=50387 RepID=UPI003B633498
MTAAIKSCFLSTTEKTDAKQSLRPCVIVRVYRPRDLLIGALGHVFDQPGKLERGAGTPLHKQESNHATLSQNDCGCQSRLPPIEQSCQCCECKEIGVSTTRYAEYSQVPETMLQEKIFVQTKQDKQPDADDEYHSASDEIITLDGVFRENGSTKDRIVLDAQDIAIKHGMLLRLDKKRVAQDKEIIPRGVVLPDGSRVLSNGNIQRPDGTIITHDGDIQPLTTTFRPFPLNGSTIQTDLSKQTKKHQLPEGYIIEPDGSIQPLGSKLLSDGTILRPDGNIVYPDGTVKSFDGHVLPLKKSIELSQSFMLPDGTIVQEDGTIVGPDGSIYPKGSRLSPGGTILLPDGKSGQKHQLPEGYIIEPGGSIQPLGSKLLSDGTILRPDGNIVYPDGTVKSFDGQVLPLKKSIELSQSFMLPDGTIVQEDGTIVGPDGSIYPTGSRLSPGGTILLPDDKSGQKHQLPEGYIIESGGSIQPLGSKLLSDGTILRPDGNIVYPNGTVKSFDGQVLPLKKSIELNQSFMLPDGTVVQEDGTVVGPDGSIYPTGSRLSPGGTILLPDSKSIKQDETLVDKDKILEKAIVKSEEIIPEQNDIYSYTNQLKTKFKSRESPHEIDIGTQKISQQIEGVLTRSNDLDERSDTNITQKDKPIIVVDKSDNLLDIDIKKDISTPQDGVPENDNTDMQLDKITAKGSVTLEDALTTKISVGVSEITETVTTKNGQHYQIPGLIAKDKENEVLTDREEAATVSELPIQRQITPDSLPISSITPESDIITRKTYSETNADTIKTDEIKSQPRSVPGIPDKDGLDDALKDKEKGASNGLPIKTRATSDSFPTPTITPESVIMKQKKSGSLNRLPIKKRVTSDSLPIRLIARESVTMKQKILSYSETDAATIKTDKVMSQPSEAGTTVNGPYPLSSVIAKDGADEVLKDKEKAATLSDLPIKSKDTPDSLPTVAITPESIIITRKISSISDQDISQLSEELVITNGEYYPPSGIIAKDGADDVLKDSDKAAQISELPIKSQITDDISTPLITAKGAIIREKDIILGTNGSVIKSAIKTSEDLSKPEIMPESAISTEKVKTFTPDGSVIKTEETVLRKFEPSETTPTANEQQYPISSTIDNDELDQILQEKEKSVTASGQQLEGKFISDSLPMPPITAETSAVKSVEKIDEIVLKTFEADVPTVKDDMSKPSDTIKTTETGEKYYSLHALDIGEYQILNDQEKVAEISEPLIKTQVTHENIPISSIVPEDSTITEKTSVIAPSGDIQLEEESVKLITASPAGTFTKTGEIGVYPPHVVRPIDGGVSSSSEQLIRLIDTELGETVLSERVKHLDDVGEAIYVDKPIIEFDSIDKKSQTEKVGNGRDKLSKSDKRHSSEVPDFVSKLSYKDIPPPLEVTDSKRPRKKRSSKTDIKVCTCHSSCTCILCSSEIMEKRASKPPKKESKTKESKTCYCRGTGNKTLTQLSPQHTAYPNNLYQPPLLHPKRKCETFVGGPPCNKPRQQFNLEKGVKQRSKISIDDVFNPSTYKRDVEKPLKKGVFKKRHGADCECVDCLCSPMIRALSTTREFFKVRDTKQIYQVSNIKCFCPNTSKKISKIPVSTNPAVPKVRSTAVVCTCDPCECQPCSDTKKDAAGTVKVDEKGALILPTMDEVMKMTPEQLKALCDCDPCNCEVCYNKPAPPVRDDVTCDLPSGDQVPMCCCRPGCVCEFCQVEEIKKQIKKLEQEIYSLKATTPTIAQDTIAQDTTHPEGCDCELCKCPLAPGKEETAKIAAAQSPQGDQNADCDCTVCLCPEGPNKDKLSSSQPTGHPDDCDCDTCRCPLSPLKDQPKTPGHPVDCDCDLCKCPLAATVGDGKMCNCGDFCLCPGRPTADKKDPMSGCTCKPTCLCPKGPMPTCECPTDECICSPCSDPRKNLMDPTQVLKKSDSDKCTCSVCKCFEEIPKHAHPDDCTCEVCKCDEEKAVIVKASECICPICKCGEGDGFPKFAEGPQHPEGCICDECRCGDEESTHPEGCICDVCKCEPEPEHPKECICDICKCEPDEQPPHPKECICDVCRCGSEEQPPHPEGCICPICICKPEEQPKHSEGCICEICKCEPPEKLIPEECTCPICQCEEKQQKESVCICDDPCKCDEKKEIKLEQITEKQQKECVCEKPCKCDEKEQTKSAPVKSCTCGDVCICDQGDTAVEKIQTATAVTAMKSTGIHQVKCTCVQCKCAEQTEHTRTEGFQGDTMKTSATHALSCDCAECKCAEETEEIKIGDLQRGKCKCGVCNCVDCYYKQDNIPHSKDCHCDFCTCVDCCETTDQTVQHKKDEEKKACKCIECKCDPCLNQIASKEKVTCKCGVCICLDCEGERVSKKDETVVISSLPEGKKDEIATVGSLPKNRSCHCIECYCDECNDERKKGSKARPEIKIQTVSPVTKTAATQPPQPRRPAGCTCLSCICIDCVSKKLLDQSGVSTEVKPLTKNTSCHCATCLCPECSAITKSPEIKGTKLENEIQSQAQGQAQIQVPAAIPTEPPQVQIASSVGPPQVQITTSVEPSAPTDPPLFELPQRINCYSKTCTCYLCEKKAVGESRPVSVPASYDTRSEGVAPLFQIPQRMQCSCKNCTCPFDCSLRSQQVAQEIKQDPFGGEKREVVTEFQKPERPLEEQKREVQLPNMQQTQSWPKAQQSMPPYVEHQSREAERTTICFCNNCQCTKCNKDVRPSTAPQSTQAPQSDSSQKVNVPAPIVKSAAIVTVTSWHIQQSRPRSAPGGKSYESCACAMCTCPSDCINSTKTARSDCRCPDCIMEKPSRISAKVGVSQQQSIARASAMCACLSSRVSSAAKSAPSSDCRCPDCIMEKQSRISAKVGETIYDTSVGKISKQRSKGRAKVTSSSKYTTCACASCPDTSVKEEEIHQVASRSQDRKDVRCVCHNCSVCPKARNVDLATIDNETLLKSIESSTKEHCECKEQIKEIRSVLRSIKKSCFVAEKQAMTKPLVKQASDFKQTMSGLKLALINLQEKCKAKDKMIKLMTGELKSRTSSQTLWKVLNTCTEDAPDYDKADDVKDKIPFHTLYPVGEEKSTFDEKVARATERERGQKSTKSCKCGKIPTKQEDRSVNLIGFEVVDIKRIMEDSIIIKWEPPKSNLVTGYDIFINGLHKSKIMSGGRTSAMINSIDLSITNQVTIYALTKRGRCEPPAIAIYEVRSRK